MESGPEQDPSPSASPRSPSDATPGPIDELRSAEDLQPVSAERGRPDEERLRTVLDLERPHPNLLRYYFLASLLLGPFFPVLLVPLYFRYRTMRYEFDDEGVSMRWGVLFRREISLNYSRLQDIHLKSNVVQRWLGLGDVKLQTASGSAAAEMTIEGLQEFELVRDFLYSRMRGVKGVGRAGRTTSGTVVAREPAAAPDAATPEVVMELRAARREMTLLAERLEELARSGNGGSSS